MLGNAIDQRDNQQRLDDPCGANADATFNLLKNDWSLHIIGCRGLKKKTGCTDYNEKFTHQFRPIAFALGNTENGAVYRMLYKLTCEFLQMALGYKWILKAMCQDHSQPGANAAIETWPSTCAIILCWPHIKLNAVKNNKQKLSDKSLADTANEHITYVHCSRTVKQFDKLLALMLVHWRDDLVEDAFADWFHEEYGTDPWRNWHVTASGIPGFTGNNNAEESFNREVKRGEHIKKDTIGVYITETLPRTIRNWSLELGTQAGPIVNTIPGTPNRHVIMKAIDIVTRGHDEQNDIAVCNYFKVSDSLKLTTGRQPVVNSFIQWIHYQLLRGVVPK